MSNNVQCAAVLVDAIESREFVLIRVQKVLNNRYQLFRLSCAIFASDPEVSIPEILFVS